MLELKPFVTPNTISVSTLFERILFNKLPEYADLYKTMTASHSEQRLAFNYLKDLLTNYQPNTIIFMNNSYFRVNTDNGEYLNNQYFLDSDKNTCVSQKQTISMLEKALFVSAYMQKIYDEHHDDAHKNNSFFSVIPQEDLDSIGYTKLESDRRNIHRHFYAMPFIITETEVDNYSR